MEKTKDRSKEVKGVEREYRSEGLEALKELDLGRDIRKMQKRVSARKREAKKERSIKDSYGKI